MFTTTTVTTTERVLNLRKTMRDCLRAYYLSGFRNDAYFIDLVPKIENKGILSILSATVRHAIRSIAYLARVPTFRGLIQPEYTHGFLSSMVIQ